MWNKWTMAKRESPREFERSLAQNTLDALTVMLDVRDPRIRSHCERVAELGREIAKEMKLSSDVDDVREACLLHDLGMVGIPDMILFKPGTLTAAEHEFMKQHTVLGFRALQSMPHLQAPAEVAHTHHERWDGRGYPDRLRGEQIPLAARICSVAEVFDSLLTTQTWRPAWTGEKARGYITANSGTQFDPNVVEAFVAVVPTP